MMRFCLIITLLCLPFNLFSQNPDGLYREYYDSGELKTLGRYKDNKRIGDWKNYHKNGVLSSEYSYTVDGKSNKERITYYENGNVKFETKLREVDYITIFYYESGELKREKAYKNGYLKEFYKNGSLMVEGNQINSELSGEWKQFDQPGNLKWTVNYQQGYRNGPYKEYYENGIIKTEGEIKNDKKNGKELRYNDNGVLEWEGSYLDGELYKTWTRFNSRGEKIEKLKYKNGVLVSGKINLSPTIVPDGVFEKVPLYPGCDNLFGNSARRKCMSEKISRHVNTKFNIDLAGKLGIDGLQKIIVKFNIDKNGNITDINATASVLALEKEAERVIKLLPKIIRPGIQEGKTVKVPYSMPIVFRVSK